MSVSSSPSFIKSFSPLTVSNFSAAIMKYKLRSRFAILKGYLEVFAEWVLMNDFHTFVFLQHVNYFWTLPLNQLPLLCHTHGIKIQFENFRLTRLWRLLPGFHFFWGNKLSVGIFIQFCGEALLDFFCFNLFLLCQFRITSLEATKILIDVIRIMIETSFPTPGMTVWNLILVITSA